MEGLIEGPFAEALERGRERFNARFGAARALNPRLDPAVFSDVLRTRVGPVVQAVANIDPDRVDLAVEAGYDLALDLTARECLGPAARHPAVDRVWRELLPRIPRLVAAAPRRVAAQLSNAAHNLSLWPSASPERWVRIFERFGEISTDVEECLRAGQVAAWRCGMAQYRGAAIEIWKQLPGPLQIAALDLPAGTAATPAQLERDLSDPWCEPGTPDGARKLAIVARAGGFRGFGGPFICPPDVLHADGVFYAFDTESCWTLHADCYGVTFVRAGRDLPSGSASRDGFSLSRSGEVRKETVCASFPELREASSQAASETTLAVTLPRSHFVILVAER